VATDVGAIADNIGLSHDVPGGIPQVSASSRPLAVLRMFDGLLGLTRPMAAFDPEQPANGLGWAPMLAMQASLAVVLCGVAANASRTGSGFAVLLFYAACGFFFIPAAARVIHPAASQNERLVIVLATTMALFAIRVLREPVAFIDHDEFLHWLTTLDILERGRLFTPNPLLPVSPLFPGLEIATTAIANVTGSSIFTSAVVLLGTGRLIFVAALYLAYERITGSARVAAVGCLVYMGCSTFLVFDAHYSYESLAVVFVVLIWFSETFAEREPSPRAWLLSLASTIPFLCALSVTHHMSAFFAAAILVGVAGLELVRKGCRQPPYRVLFVASCAVLLPLLWSHLVGDPTAGYLGPVFYDGLRDVSHLLSPASGRKLFVSDDGVVAPAWQRYITIAAVAAVCLGLSSGFIRSLRTAYSSGPLDSRRASPRGWLWNNSWLVLLTLLTTAYPASILFRLTRSGWEIGNRVGALSFLGVGVVVAIGVAAHWQGASHSKARAVVLGIVAAAILIGGVISGEGPWILVPAHFRVSADAASIEPMDISAAEWARRWLGPGNLFTSDRINRLLLATYGRQDVATTLQDPHDTSIAILSEKLGHDERDVLRQVGIQYVMVDLRITTSLPVVGVYFDGAMMDRSYVAPPAPRSLLKFDAEPDVGRPFDNGYLIVYDVRAIDDAR
jgi:hypothetical protein